VEEWDRLLDDLREEMLLREDELELLHEIDMRLLASRRSISATFRYIVSKARDLLKSDFAAILLRRGGQLETAYAVGSPAAERVAVQWFLGSDALRCGNAINIPDLAALGESGRPASLAAPGGPPMRSFLAAPIRVHDQMIGVLAAESTRERAFRPLHERVITAIAGQAAIALQRAQLFEQDRLFSEVDELIFAGQEPSDSASGQKSQHVVQAALRKVMDALQVLEHIQLSAADIMFVRSDNELEVAHSTNPADIGILIAIDTSICGMAVREKRTVSIGDVNEEPKYRRLQGSATISEIAVPIILGGSDIVIGVLNVESEDRNAFEGFGQVLLESFADRVRTLLAFARLRTDVTKAVELRTASDLLVAVGDQASNMIHRMNNTVGGMRLRIIELQELADAGDLGESEFLSESLTALRNLADEALLMPEEVTLLLTQQGASVNVNQVVGAVLEQLAIPPNVELELRLDPDVPRLSLYSFDIVVQNLIENALDAMPSGGRLSIWSTSVFHPDLDSGYVELNVTDSGVGISAEILPRLFELNFTTKHSSDDSNGPGLWWSRNLVLRAKGSITVSSAVGRGSSFVVKLPVVPAGR